MKKLLILLFLSVSVSAFSQTVTLKSSFNLASDTVTNAATGYVQGRSLPDGRTVAVQVTATKISGTVAGTITLMGSVDGVTYLAATLANASTALHTFTATNVASQSFIWNLTGSPYNHYRVSWTSTGSMSASFIATLVSKN